MDSAVIIAIVGIFVLLGVIYVVMNSTGKPVVDVKSKAQKRREIIAGYEAELEAKLRPLIDDSAAMRAAKVKLLGRFSNELSMNVFFDYDEKKEIISELAAYQPE
ncbi:MAG: hypothetical protein U9Q62_07890 [Campylobacterota bacterium]|nr:hypothetical protein [Campylobacterota bacterium]